MAQTAIKTPSTGLVSGEVTIDVNGFKMPAYRCAPAGKTGLPVVLVISEIFGVHEYIADALNDVVIANFGQRMEAGLAYEFSKPERLRCSRNRIKLESELNAADIEKLRLHLASLFSNKG